MVSAFLNTFFCPQKEPHFREFAPTKGPQLEGPLSASSQKSLLHKHFVAKALQKAKKYGNGFNVLRENNLIVS